MGAVVEIFLFFTFLRAGPIEEEEEEEEGLGWALRVFAHSALVQQIQNS